jgi:hypothetical protein
MSLLGDKQVLGGRGDVMAPGQMQSQIADQAERGDSINELAGRRSGPHVRKDNRRVVGPE